MKLLNSQSGLSLFITFEQKLTRTVKGKFFVIAVLFFLGTSLPQNKDQVKRDVQSACSKGDVSYLNPYMHGFVLAQIPGSSGMTSAERCRSLLKTFFKNNPPRKFTLQESGKTGENFFIIGTLWSGQKKWNVYFLLAPQSDRYQLQQIDIQRISR